MLNSNQLEDFAEIEFTHAVLAAASEVFTTEEKKYLGQTRLMKLVAFTADILEFPLTRGWYRYGYFAPTSHQCISDLLNSYQTFERFPDLQNTLRDDSIRNEFRDAVRSLRQYFLLNNDDFDKWVHGEMAPVPYRAYYKYETVFYNTLTHIQQSISGNVPLDLSDFNRIVTDFEHSLEYVEDPAILGPLFGYVDFWELLVLRIQKRGLIRKMEPFVTNLIRIYGEFLRPALTPYEKTLCGMNAEQEKEAFKRKIKSYLRQFEKELTFLEDMGRSFSLLATLDEMREELGQRTADWEVVDTAVVRGYEWTQDKLHPHCCSFFEEFPTRDHSFYYSKMVKEELSHVRTKIARANPEFGYELRLLRRFIKEFLRNAEKLDSEDSEYNWNLIFDVVAGVMMKAT
jgi:hypothetical protein